ncbi:MAG TPA: MarR family transcriptional regulator [Thermoplasmata archaeon]|nr:MarR family transcriptional regulator [Thermoplasmata archaeon]
MSRDARARHKDDTVELLTRTGIPKNVARALVFLSSREETTSVEIEKATGLRQPEVSIAMQELRRRRWVEKRDIKKEGKGRPVHAYRLTIVFAEIVDAIAKEERRRIDEIQRTLRRLKRRAS